MVEGKLRPYDDEVGADGLFRYRYFGKDPMHRDNVGLRLAMERHIPLIYLYGLAPGQCDVRWPVYIVADVPQALCFAVAVGERLNSSALLDAAHVLPDGHPKGEPWVSNGLSLCKLHHAAFDNDFLGVRPDLVVEIRKDNLDEADGPMLMQRLQECHNKRLVVVSLYL